MKPDATRREIGEVQGEWTRQERVRVRKEKWPLSGTDSPRLISTWDARLLGVDQHGTWLFCGEGEQHRKADGSCLTVPSNGVQLLPASGWWAAWWWERERWIGVDICTPPVRVGSGWRYVDLELDLAKLADGRVMIVDEDEFEVAVKECQLPAEVVAAARHQAEDLQSRLASEDDPVVAAGWRWLDSI